jgi:carboxyvinyl-carboxyphosphonate phosphorylmutase
VSGRERFRAVLAEERCVEPASVFDPLSARIAEELGFEMGMLAGSLVAMTVLGAPDITLTTLTEVADQAHRICRASRLPLLVDADHGFGNALNAMRTVQELESAGVAALTIEDTALPRAYGSGPAPYLVSVEEGAGKVAAAVAGRRDPALVVVARTSVALAGPDEAVARVQAYEAAGADALFLVGVRTREELEAIEQKVGLPLLVATVGPEVADLDYLARHRVRMLLQGHRPFLAAVGAVHAVLRAQREGVSLPDDFPSASSTLLADVTRDADFAEWSARFLG